MVFRLFTATCDAIVPFVLGLVILLVGLRTIGKKPGESEAYDTFYKLWERKLKVIGSALIALAAIFFIRVMVINRVEAPKPGETRADDAFKEQ